MTLPPFRCACLLAFACAAIAGGQARRMAPRSVLQGGVVRITSPDDAATARMNGRVIPLFPQPDGEAFGLMPVPVTAKPGEYKLELLTKNGALARAETITVLNAHFPVQNIVISKALSELKPTPEESDAVAAFRKEVLPTRYWSEPLSAPVPGCMTSLFGVQRLHNGKPTGDYHAGLDLRGAAGAPIRAAAAGVVKIAAQFNLHGGTVAIDHGQGLQSMYLHMSKIAAVPGAVVQKGDVIGYVGSTGRSTAPHLHWTLYANGVAVNPLQWVHVRPCAPPARRSRKTRPVAFKRQP